MNRRGLVLVGQHETRQQVVVMIVAGRQAGRGNQADRLRRKMTEEKRDRTVHDKALVTRRLPGGSLQQVLDTNTRGNCASCVLYPRTERVRLVVYGSVVSVEYIGT